MRFVALTLTGLIPLPEADRTTDRTTERDAKADAACAP